MSDKNSDNNQSSSDNQTLPAPKVLKGGDIIERGSRLRYVDPDDTIVVRFEGNIQKKTRS
jgi:hypothetical protein